MSSDDDRPSVWQRIYVQLFKVFGPAQVSQADEPQTETTESERARIEGLVEFEKETRDGKTYLVRRPPRR